MKQKILILLPDGVGLRNFAYSQFYKIGTEMGMEVTFWNNTPFDLGKVGIPSVALEGAKNAAMTDIYKVAKTHIELSLNNARANTLVYDGYRFPMGAKTWKAKLKKLMTQWAINTHHSEKGVARLRSKMKQSERKTAYYKQCKATLEKEKPALVFCTNQRHTLSIAPMVAAQDLGIPTATFIFSWDNLPKATMVLETDYYFVWSQHMKKELQYYYPFVKESQIKVCGTPQFESHFESERLLSRAQFFETHGLDINKKYLCYSGDDVTTSPDDPDYLRDTALAVRQLNQEGANLGIVFRSCPVDFSSRYDEVLETFKDVIVPIAPLWKSIAEGWNTIMPIPEDLDLQMNTIAHTEMVINLGSSMVFDYVAHQKPCAYINYDFEVKRNPKWSIYNCYKFIHFQSMPHKEAVVWMNNPSEMAEKIKEALANPSRYTQHAQKWFEIINEHPPKEASKRIWEEIKEIIK